MYQASININAPVTDEPKGQVYTVAEPFGDLKLSAVQWITSRDPRYFEAIAQAAWKLAGELDAERSRWAGWQQPGAGNPPGGRGA